MNNPGLRVENSRRCIQIYRDGDPEPILIQEATENKRPFIHPVRAPDGKGILTENVPPHHPWQHGIYVGLNDVNGVGFWKEGLRNHPMDGTFHPKPLKPIIVQGHQAHWEVETDWRDPQGNRMLTETQRWSFRDLGVTYELDLQWTLKAAIDLTFGAHKYGGLFLRMPYRDDRGGTAINSEGQLDQAAEGQRARWVACSMLVEDRLDQAGIAYMDHPSNPEHPVPWRVDNKLGIAPSRCIAGPWKLSEGESQTYHHRVLVFCGQTDPELVDRIWTSFAALEYNN